MILSNDQGNLTQLTKKLSPFHFHMNSKSKTISGAYSLILIDNGAVYAVGCGTLGRLGRCMVGLGCGILDSFNVRKPPLISMVYHQSVL